MQPADAHHYRARASLQITKPLPLRRRYNSPCRLLAAALCRAGFLGELQPFLFFDVRPSNAAPGRVAFRRPPITHITCFRLLPCPHHTGTVQTAHTIALPQTPTLFFLSSATAYNRSPAIPHYPLEHRSSLALHVFTDSPYVTFLHPPRRRRARIHGHTSHRTCPAASLFTTTHTISFLLEWFGPA